jgi:integrase/recombinase XerD
MAAPSSPEFLVEAWLNHCKAQGLVAASMRGYAYTMRGVFLPFCVAQGIEDIEEMTQARFDVLNQQLLAREYRGRPISRMSVDHYLRAIRSFCAWVKEEEGYSLGRPRGIRKGKARPKDVLTREEIQAMEDACRTERNKLIIRTLGDTGMRVGELVKLTPDDLIEKNRQHFLRVLGGSHGAKGGNHRMVPIPRLGRRLQRYIDRGRGEPAANRIFVNSRQIHGVYGALTTSGVWQMVVSSAEDANLTKKVHPHLFRHSLVTHLRRKHFNDAEISHALGNFTALNDYTHLTDGDSYDMLVSLG